MNVKQEIKAAQERLNQSNADMASDEDNGELNQIKREAYTRAITMEQDRIKLLGTLS